MGEQLELLDPPPFSPGLPKPATLPDLLLRRLLEGESFTHPEWEAKSYSWRLAASVQHLKDLDWPVQSLPEPAPTRQCPDRVISRYRLPQAAIEAGRQLLRGAR
jgi:hypothetical protein